MPGGLPYIMTIGGLDPCNGAGITADVKTVEALGGYALSVQTCLTIQNEDTLERVIWHEPAAVMDQVRILLQRYSPSIVKVSVLKDLGSTLELVRQLQGLMPRVRIIWDPVRSSTAGTDFYADGGDSSTLARILGHVFLATPNCKEAGEWHGGSPVETARRMAVHTNICLKGGHNDMEMGTDILFCMNGEEYRFPAPSLSPFSKHGSGCVFASSVAVFLARGCTLTDAVPKAKAYVRKFLDSDKGLLGLHPVDINLLEHVEN